MFHMKIGLAVSVFLLFVSCVDKGFESKVVIGGQGKYDTLYMSKFSRVSILNENQYLFVLNGEKISI